MGDSWFYVSLGLKHVLDLNAYDHILFLSALSLPFTFRDWKKVLLLVTVFTLAHCFSLALSVYEMLTVDVALIEFLIPVTIFLTGIFNIWFAGKMRHSQHMWNYFGATGFFGLIHGFGFSNYFKMLMAEETEKMFPLFGFALGIEISQVLIILLVLILALVFLTWLKVRQSLFVQIMSLIVICITIPMLIATFPW